MVWYGSGNRRETELKTAAVTVNEDHTVPGQVSSCGA